MEIVLIYGPPCAILSFPCNEPREDRLDDI
jgi:hypothetical protein